MKYRVSHITLLLLLCSTLTPIANALDVGAPRTVRLIYFVPNDRTYRADVEKQMKKEIRTVQTFYATAMNANGFGKTTFHIETDQKDEPIAHRVDGKHPFSHYDNTLGIAVINELRETFDLTANIYFVVLENDVIQTSSTIGGVGGRLTKTGGWLLVPNKTSWDTVAHELGHTFGLNHDYRNDAYIMSYSPKQDQLSACAAFFLSVHPYFNPDTPADTPTKQQLPTIKLLSSRKYPPGASSVPIRVEVSDSDGLHQVLLYAVEGLQKCHRLTGEKKAVIEFDYNGWFGLEGFTSLADFRTGEMVIESVDTLGNVTPLIFTLAESSPYHIADLPGHGGPVLSVAFSPSGHLLAVGAQDGSVTLWEVATREKKATLPKTEKGVERIAFSPSGHLLAVDSREQVTLWSVATQQQVAHFRHPSEFTSVAFSPEGKHIAAGMANGTVTFWDVETHRNIATRTHGNYVTDVAFSRQGIMASASDDGTMTLWDGDTQIKTLKHEAAVNCVAFSPDGHTLALGGEGDISTIQLFDVASRQTVAKITHGAPVYSMAFLPDGETLASSGWDGTLQLWDVTTQVQFATFSSAGPISSVAVSPKGSPLASGGPGTNIVELWDTSTVIPLRVEALTAVDIPDKNLRAVIADVLGVNASEPITKGKMKTLTKLEAPNANISNLTGLQFATELAWLSLGYEYSESPPINSNTVEDLTPIAELTRLTFLDLSSNAITDISALSGLTHLTSLWLSSNTITDISALSTLTTLRELGLDNNAISDISALSTLTKLRTLDLSGNGISDLAPLTGLTNLTDLWLLGNPLNTSASTTHIPALQRRGTEVHFNTPKDTPKADVNGDGVINILDLVRVANAFGTDAGDNPEADVNNDGEINLLDLVHVANFFAKTQ